MSFYDYETALTERAYVKKNKFYSIGNIRLGITRRVEYYCMPPPSDLLLT